MPDFKPLAAGTVLALALATGALAQPAAGERAMLQQACAADYLAFCSNPDPNSPEVDRCFQAKMKQLSPGCQTAITGYMQRNPKGGRPAN